MSKTRLGSRRIRVSASSAYRAPSSSARRNRRANARRRGTPLTWSSAKVVIRKPAVWILFALFASGAAVAIWFSASHKFKFRAFGSKAAVDHPPLPTKKASAHIQIDNHDDALMTLLTAELISKSAYHGPIGAKNPVIHRKSPTPIPPAPANLELNAPDAKSQVPEQRSSEARDENGEKEPRRTGFKTLEKERREAERKRTRLENMYQKGLISTRAYKDGQAEYQSQIEKYRREAIGGKQTQP